MVSSPNCYVEPALVWCGVVRWWCGVVWCGVVWCGWRCWSLTVTGTEEMIRGETQTSPSRFQSLRPTSNNQHFVKTWQESQCVSCLLSTYDQYKASWIKALYVIWCQHLQKTIVLEHWKHDINRMDLWIFLWMLILHIMKNTDSSAVQCPVRGYHDIGKMKILDFY